MHAKIMLLTREGLRKRALATTEHSASSHGQPVIVLGGIPYGYGDIVALGMTCLSSDQDVVTELEASGFPAQKLSTHVVTLSLSKELETAFRAEAAKRGKTFSGAVQEAMKEWMANA